jgi:hypothetical protein
MVGRPHLRAHRVIGAITAGEKLSGVFSEPNVGEDQRLPLTRFASQRAK